MNLTPQAKRFKLVTKPRVFNAYEGVEFARGKVMPKIVPEGEERWDDFVIDTFKDANKKPITFDQYKSIPMQSLFAWFYEKHIHNWQLLKMQLKTKEDVKKFDATVRELIMFHNRSTLSPNEFIISAQRVCGEQAGIRFIAANESAKIRPSPFKFSIRIEMNLKAMEL